MNKNEIVNEIATEQLVEKIVSKFGGEEDLVNDIYLSLLQKDEELIQQLYDTNSLPFYIIRMVRNNVHSVSSPYYTTYVKSQKYNISIDELKSNI